jgi:hypothetical protein
VHDEKWTARKSRCPHRSWELHCCSEQQCGSLLVMSVILYSIYGASWVLLALLFLAPDLSLLGYVVGPRVGAAAFNAFHTHPLPVILAAFGLLGGSTLAVAVVLIWLAHIGMHRTLGYGLQ